MNTTPENFTPFDTADHLNSVEDVAAYLEAVIDESPDDSAAIARALGIIARSRNFTQIAREAGMSRAGLHKELPSDENPTLATVIKVTHAVGLRFRFEAAT